MNLDTHGNTRGLAWFHCFSGIAGDMAFASLVDAGADLEEVLTLLRRMPVGGWDVEAQAVLRCGIAATHLDVRTGEDGGVIRTHAHIVGLIEEARLPDRARERSLATFSALAEVEGRLHGKPANQVHFHEVGGLDSIVDVVGTCCALEVLGIDEVHASAIATGTGMVRSAHGLIPNPPPAVVALLAEVGAPTYGRDAAHELTTPTGAALLAANSVSFGPMPPMAITATGFGAGSREVDGLPNVTQVVLGAPATPGGSSGHPGRPGQPVMLLEANIDDATGETLAHTIAALLDAGAHDAWITPILMKKGRPAYTVSALADLALADQVADVLVRETGTLGVRGSRLERWPSPRAVGSVEVAGLPIRIKISVGRIKVEHDDAARVARRSGLPLREVVSLAEEAARRRRPEHPDHPSGPHLHPGGGITT